MLDALRRGAQSWVAKVLFSILILAFAVWGIPHNMLNFGGASLAEVGDQEITISDFQRTFQNELARVSRGIGKRLTTEEALSFGLDREVMERLVAQSALASHAGSLGLALSDTAIVDGIKSDPAFQGPDGKFSRQGFNELLRQLGLSEQGFINLRRGDELRRQITDALTGAVVAPAPLVEQAHAYANEQRVIEFVRIDPDQAVKVAEPDAAALDKHYSDNKGRFMTPEYRKFATLIVSPAEIKNEFTFTDDELKAAYEETRATYDVEERRRVQQIAFKDKGAADEARRSIIDGKKSFMDVAKELGAKEGDANLGLITKKQLIDRKVADAAFALPRDQLSEVIEGTFATVLVRAIEVQAGKSSTFEEVRDKVRDGLAEKKARTVIQERIDLVEEARNAGKTLTEAGAEQKLRFIEVEAASVDNKTPDGKTALDHPDSETILKAVFEAALGADQSGKEIADGAFAWTDLLAVNQARQKSLDEARDEVRADYMAAEKRKKLEELADGLAGRLKDGQGMARIAADAYGKAETTQPIARNVSFPGLTEAAIKRAFSLQKGGAASMETSDRSSRVVFRVAEIKAAAAPNDAQKTIVAKELKDEIRNDALMAYVEALRMSLGVTVNQSELRRATGQNRTE